MQTGISITLKPADRRRLKVLARDRNAPQKHVWRAEIVLLSADGLGLAVLRFRPGIWTNALECYLAELYVRPQRRGQGLGRALMEAAIEFARGKGADHMDLGTGEQDVVARALYESLGFSNREGKHDGPLNYFYEREI